MNNFLDKLKLSYKLIKPAAIYNNSSNIKIIMEENVNKSGIYRWVNKVNGKTYIESSVNIYKRLYKYYNQKHLTKIKTPIANALNKYGYSNFSLEILEYCDDNINILDREQYYFDLLKPEYNVLRKAGSSLGFKHSPETLELFKKLFKNRIISDETRKNLSNSALNRVLNDVNRKKISESRINIPLTSEVRDKISKAITELKGKPVTVTNVETTEKIDYINLTEAGKSIGVSRTAIRKYANSNNLIKNKFKIELK